MQEMFLGEVIRRRRIELGLTQEALCEGICEPMTISRFERGQQTPSRNRVQALLFRLGLPDDRFFGLLSRHETEVEALQQEIIRPYMRCFPRTTASCSSFCCGQNICWEKRAAPTVWKRVSHF